MKLHVYPLAAVAAALIGMAFAPSAQAQAFFQGFNNAAMPADWVRINNSTAANNSTGLWRAATAITDGAGNPVVTPYEGSHFALVGWNSSTQNAATGVTLSNWLLTPTLSLNNGDTFSFFTTTTPGSAFADRLEVRLSLAGTSTNVGSTPQSVGDFTNLLLTINPGLATGATGYPQQWTQYTVTVSGLSGTTDGRFALRYHVTDGGPAGNNSNIIGVDAVHYVPEPTTYALLGAGALLVGAAARRRARNAKA